jgi:membrane-bound ClpP family serine protease
MSEAAPKKDTRSSASAAVKLVAAIIAVVVGLFLVFASTTPGVADALFVGAIAVALAVYLWSGVTPRESKIVAVILIFVAAYAFIRGFGWLELNLLREIGGIVAIVFGVVLVLPFVRAQMAKRSAPEGAKPVKPADKA